MKYKPQLFISKEAPCKSKFNKVKDYGSVQNKPSGGLWTSSYSHIENTTAWIEWCQENDLSKWLQGKKGYLMTPAAEARIYKIDSMFDFIQLFNKYPLTDQNSPVNKCLYAHGLMPHSLLSFEAISKDYDAIWLTEMGERSTRNPWNAEEYGVHGLILYGWDVESTLWLNWVFESVEEVEEIIATGMEMGGI